MYLEEIDQLLATWKSRSEQAAADLVAWSKVICFADNPAIARCEIDTYRYRILHIAARVTRGGRQVNLRLDRNWAWAKTLAAGFGRLRAAFD